MLWNLTIYGVRISEWENLRGIFKNFKKFKMYQNMVVRGGYKPCYCLAQAQAKLQNIPESVIKLRNMTFFMFSSGLTEMCLNHPGETVQRDLGMMER